MADKEKLQKIGALWKSKNGKALSGVIQDGQGNDIRVFILKNGFKQEDKHPDFQVFLGQERQNPNKPASGSKSKSKKDAEEAPFG